MQFPLGKMILQRCDEEVERNAEDRIGDAAMEAAESKISLIDQQTEAKKSDLTVIATFLTDASGMKFVVSRWAAAIDSWSKIRIEEQWSRVEQLVANCATFCQTALQASIESVGESPTELHDSMPSLPDEHGIKEHTARTLAACAHKVLPKFLDRVADLRRVISALAEATKDINNFLSRLPKLCPGVSEESLALLAPKATFVQTKDWLGKLMCALCCGVSLLRLLATPDSDAFAFDRKAIFPCST